MKIKVVILSVFIIILVSIPTSSPAIEKWDGKITTIRIGNREPRIPGKVKPQPTDVIEEFLETINAAHDPDPETDIAAVSQRMRPIPGIHVYDAFDNHLGILQDIGGAITIYNYKMKTFIKISSQTGDLIGNNMYYESDDCAGQPWVNSGATYYASQFCGTYYTGERVAPITLEVKSWNSPGLCNCTPISQYSEMQVVAVPAIEVPPQAFGYHIPVALPLQFKAQVRLIIE